MCLRVSGRQDINAIIRVPVMLCSRSIQVRDIAFVSSIRGHLPTSNSLSMDTNLRYYSLSVFLISDD